MKLNKKLKKGFTLVELVVVIAVIAILATVSVSTYMGVKNKANTAGDQSIVSQINLSLTTVDEDKPATMEEARQAILSDGIDIGKVTSKTKDTEYAWDRVNNRYVLVKTDKLSVAASTNYVSVVYPTDYKYGENRSFEDFFVVAESKDEATNLERFSLYLSSEANWGDSIDVISGLDVGEVEIDEVNFATTAAKDVVIRTNLGKLTVTAPNATVRHYGDVENVNIVSIDKSNSYHEYGRAGYVEIKAGHFVAQDDSEVIALVNTGASTEVKIDAEDGATIKQTITTDSSAAGTAHGGNVSLTYDDDLTDEEKEDIIYNAEAVIANIMSVNGVYFKDISKAFNKVEKNFGDGYLLDEDLTITLYKDIVGDGFRIDSGKVILDLNGCTYDINGTVGSQSTTTNGFQTIGGDVTIKNGTLTSSVAKHLIQNYTDLTLDNLIIDCSKNAACENVVSTNSGKTIIKDTKIIAYDGCLAFDVCAGWGGYTKDEVIVSGNSVIEGRIQLGDYTGYDSTVAETMKLTLNSGDFTKATLITYFYKSGQNIHVNAPIFDCYKASDVNLAAPSGYSWNSDGKLVKNN